ncbi:UNKNOWN [Stylonychia lemnae]|uniref:Uncharacterized protein n=1 Tax=Stylonychia lemnae TaxID=5949 RepID=A0A078AEP4_STYLE|nr:UNKNOWN [Stylonychia lemnae]|eukprot:CDW80695.1 UNKNOWN [Stylonychia lemnae]
MSVKRPAQINQQNAQSQQLLTPLEDKKLLPKNETSLENNQGKSRQKAIKAIGQRNKSLPQLSPRAKDLAEVDIGKKMTLNNLREHIEHFISEIEDDLYQVEVQDPDGGDEEYRGLFYNEQSKQIVETLLENNKSMVLKVSEVANAIAKVAQKLSLIKQQQQKDIDREHKEANPDLKEADQQLQSAQLQARALQHQLMKVKDHYNSLGEQIDKKRHLENQLIDLDRQKAQLLDVIQSQQKYLTESSQILNGSSQAVSQQTKLESVKDEIKELKKQFRQLSTSIREKKPEKMQDEFQQVVDVTKMQQQLKLTIDIIKRGVRVRQSQQTERTKKVVATEQSPLRIINRSKIPPTIDEEIVIKKKNLGLINKVNQSGIIDYQNKLKQIENQITERSKLIDQYNSENNELASEIKLLTDKIDPKNLGIMQVGASLQNQRLYGEQENAKIIIFKRNYSRPQNRLESGTSPSKVSEVNKSIDFLAQRNGNEKIVKSRFPSISQQDSKFKNGILAVNQSMDFRQIQRHQDDSEEEDADDMSAYQNKKDQFINAERNNFRKLQNAKMAVKAIRNQQQINSDKQTELSKTKTQKRSSHVSPSQSKSFARSDMETLENNNNNQSISINNQSIERQSKPQLEESQIEESIIDNSADQYSNQISPVQNKSYEVKTAIQNGKFQR